MWIELVKQSPDRDRVGRLDTIQRGVCWDLLQRLEIELRDVNYSQ